MYMQNDRIVYVGSKRSDLSAAVGFIVNKVSNEEGVYVVDFNGDAYIMPESSLAPYRPTGRNDRVPEVMPVRRRRSDDDE